MKSITEDENVAQKTKSLRRKICTLSKENLKPNGRISFFPKAVYGKRKLK